jgi:hypothetical protein
VYFIISVNGRIFFFIYNCHETNGEFSLLCKHEVTENTEKNNTMEVKQKALINISLKMTLYSIKSEL